MSLAVLVVGSARDALSLVMSSRGLITGRLLKGIAMRASKVLVRRAFEAYPGRERRARIEDGWWSSYGVGLLEEATWINASCKAMRLSVCHDGLNLSILKL